MSAGYENAPITQLLSVIVLLLSTAFKSTAVTLDLYRLLHGEVWRLITSFFVFQGSAQAIVGLILLYTCRQFERQMGSRKFGAFIVFSFLVSTLVSLGVVVTAASMGFYLVPSSGPFSLIFALLMFYYWHIPKLYATQYSIAAQYLSEKTWTYLLAAQLMFSDGLPSLVVALSGLLAGYLYETDGYGFQNFRLPRFIESFFGMVGGFFVALFPRPAATQNQQPPVGAAGGSRQNLIMGNNRGGNGNGAGFSLNDLNQFHPLDDHGDNVIGGRGVRPPLAPVVPSEEAVETLMGMGFERQAVIQALQSSNHNVEAAANLLLR